MDDHERYEMYAGQNIFKSNEENALGMRVTLGKKEDGLYFWTNDYHITHLSREEALRLVEAIKQAFS
jgi:hypothetical protein